MFNVYPIFYLSSFVAVLVAQLLGHTGRQSYMKVLVAIFSGPIEVKKVKWKHINRPPYLDRTFPHYDLFFFQLRQLIKC